MAAAAAPFSLCMNATGVDALSSSRTARAYALASASARIFAGPADAMALRPVVRLRRNSCHSTQSKKETTGQWQHGQVRAFKGGIFGDEIVDRRMRRLDQL